MDIATLPDGGTNTPASLAHGTGPMVRHPPMMGDKHDNPMNRHMGTPAF